MLMRADALSAAYSLDPEGNLKNVQCHTRTEADSIGHALDFHGAHARRTADSSESPVCPFGNSAPAQVQQRSHRWGSLTAGAPRRTNCSFREWADEGSSEVCL